MEDEHLPQVLPAPPYHPPDPRVPQPAFVAAYVDTPH